MRKNKWFVYILECSDNTLYSGITIDLDRRVKEHNSSIKGAKYTKARRPVKLVYSCGKKNKIDAAKEEWKIKHLKREEKIDLIKNIVNKH